MENGALEAEFKDFRDKSTEKIIASAMLVLKVLKSSTAQGPNLELEELFRKLCADQRLEFGRAGAAPGVR
jgi:hypothetical protein